MIRRREFIAGISAAAWPLAVRAPRSASAQQPGKIWRIGFIGGASRESTSELWPGIPQGLRELGYVEGRDFVIEWRYAEGDPNRFPAIATELVELKVDVFVLGTSAAVRPVQQATSTIPIVMAFSTDPIGNGFAASLRHPGGQVTGLASMQDDATPKQLELLAAMVPNLAHVGFLRNENTNASPMFWNAQTAARQLGVNLFSVGADNLEQLDGAWGTFAMERVGAVMVSPSAFFYLHRYRIANAALAHRLPTMLSQTEYTEAGGLMSYGENLKEFYRRAGRYIDKIFKGEKPADLPVVQPTKYEFIINLKTAKALGLTIPPNLLALADEVIE